jgi:alginate O-acetyltransferase complex protein AlgI
VVFSGVSFLFYFLPIVVLLYAVIPARGRNPLLLTASLVFYTWGAGALVGILFVSIVVDYGLGFVAARGHIADDQRLRRLAVTGSVVVNLGLLAWFKYAGWLITEASDAGLWTGAVPNITLPIGISFFTFQSMSYTIDVARGRCPHLLNPLDFALYVTLFPQLIAGPIVRYHEIEEQIRSRSHSLSNVGEGAIRFSHGLAKKVIVADTIAPVADAAFAQSSPTMGVAWLGILAYTMQIYFDFSGYSDMAIGLGKMFGFTFPENFNRPYAASSITDFWRRWHITLSNWFRDYVFIPLGGSRGTAASVYANLLIVFLLTGIWHGANWTFVAWGAYHGSWLLAERRFGLRNLGTSGPGLFRRASTFLIVVLGWVIFRAENMTAAVDYYRAMFSLDTFDVTEIQSLLSTRIMLTLLLASLATVALPRSIVGGPALVRRDNTLAMAGRAAVMLIALPVSLLLVASGSFSPFLYFQF